MALPEDKDVGMSVVIFPKIDGFEGGVSKVQELFGQPGGGLEWNTKKPIPVLRITSVWPLI